MNNDDDKGQNIIDLAGARKQQQTTAKAKAKANMKAYTANTANTKEGKATGKIRVWHWLQFIGFLLVMSYLMTLCTG